MPGPPEHDPAWGHWPDGLSVDCVDHPQLDYVYQAQSRAILRWYIAVQCLVGAWCLLYSDGTYSWHCPRIG